MCRTSLAVQTQGQLADETGKTKKKIIFRWLNAVRPLCGKMLMGFFGKEGVRGYILLEDLWRAMCRDNIRTNL